ncbi:hypothetical protein Q7C36_002877 [Tachysurus vachellii]|uniref:Uncharacterized protein n=1 Tax=Tachysurus vachellii TaxID=175792 RepID=A0AA88NRU7_TACVA|nr:hypothetical protein Q7C36_002873 [Tachysurus vachellii]KAK2863723.1 hypothetical protein Q7C36_002877 [Tachysurus vachellii]
MANNGIKLRPRSSSSSGKREHFPKNAEQSEKALKDTSRNPEAVKSCRQKILPGVMPPKSLKIRSEIQSHPKRFLTSSVASARSCILTECFSRTTRAGTLSPPRDMT